MGRVLRIELANAQNHAGLYECAVRNNNGFDSVRSTLEFLSKWVLLVSDFKILGPVQYPGSHSYYLILQYRSRFSYIILVIFNRDS